MNMEMKAEIIAKICPNSSGNHSKRNLKMKSKNGKSSWIDRLPYPKSARSFWALELAAVAGLIASKITKIWGF